MLRGAWFVNNWVLALLWGKYRGSASQSISATEWKVEYV